MVELRVRAPPHVHVELAAALGGAAGRGGAALVVAHDAHGAVGAQVDVEVFKDLKNKVMLQSEPQ